MSSFIYFSICETYSTLSIFRGYKSEKDARIKVTSLRIKSAEGDFHRVNWKSIPARQSPSRTFGPYATNAVVHVIVQRIVVQVRQQCYNWLLTEPWQYQ